LQLPIQEKLLSTKQVLEAIGDRKIKYSQTESSVESLVDFAKEHHLENLVMVDNTASKDFVKNYPVFVENGFDVVGSNKIYNTLPISEYRNFRKY
jgi:aspartokinase/homoserine dehydrogenase 1